MLQLIGFDGDDTLWHSEGYYQAANAAFHAIVGRYVDLADAGLNARMLATERANLALFGYGAKGMTLSMIETAIAITGARIEAADLHRIVELGKEVLAHPVELLPGIAEAVEAVALFSNGMFPAARPPFRLIGPFQQVHDQNNQSALDFMGFTTSQRFNLLD